MAETELNDIEVTSSLALTAEVLGDLALATLSAALKTETITLTGCQAVTQTAQRLIVTGTLADFVGSKGVNAAVRLYLFDVPTIEATTERHAVLLISALPATFHVENLWNAYVKDGGQSAVTKILSGSAFADQMLLLSTLNYDNVSYIKPPFPPAEDKPDDSFIKSLTARQRYVTRGFTYWIKTSLAGSTPIPDTDFTVADSLGVLSVTPVFQEQKFLSQTKIESAGTDLVLFYFFGQPAKPQADVKFNFEFESVGLSFPLGVTTTVLPLIQLRGAITIGVRLEIEADFNLATKYLTLVLTGFPSFGDFVAQFSKEFHMDAELSAFVPENRYSGFGSITLEEVEVGIDFIGPDVDPDSEGPSPTKGPTVDLVRFVIAAEKNISLIGDLVEVRPSLSVKINSPFDAAARLFEADVYGRWLIEQAEIDTALAVSSNGYQVTAGLALGQKLNLSHLLGDMLGGQIQGIPNLNVTGFDFIGIKSGTDTFYELDLDLDTGWHLGDLPLTLDDVHLVTAFTNGKLTEAEVSATLELSDYTFTLSAEYVPDNEGWMFSGGTTPGESIPVGDFLAKLAVDMGVKSDDKFLEPFKTIALTGLYVEYRTFKNDSSQLSLFLSLHAGGEFGKFLPLDKILVRFQTNGAGIMWRFDATAPADNQKDLSALVAHLNSTPNTNLVLPESLNTLKIQELGGYYDSSLGSYGFTVFLIFGEARVFVQIDLKKQLDGKLEKDVRGQLIFNYQDPKKELTFELDLVSTPDSLDFVAFYQAKDLTPLSLASLVKAIKGDSDGVPDGLSIDIRDAVFSHHKKGSITKSIFAIDMDAGINLSSLGDLPLIGAELSDAKTLKLAFQIVYATETYTTEELKALNEGLAKNSTLKFPEAASIVGKSPNINVEVRMGAGGSFPVSLPVGLDKTTGQLQSGQAPPQPPNAVTTPADGITWFDIKKNFGPLNLSRIGFKLGTTGGIQVIGYLDGGLSLAGLTVELLGLSVSTTLTGPDRLKPSFGLNGLGIDFKKGPIEIGGALYKLTNDKVTEFDGMVTVRTSKLQLSAIGSFAELADGNKSLFIYGVLNYPLGGPGFFFVTGLAAGFGYNRKLLIPGIAELNQFPLITEAMKPQPQPPPTELSQMKDFISAKMQGMQKYLPPQVGEYFLAVGVHFTSFEMLDSFALLIVQFGEHFEVDILGISTMLVPPNVTETPIAEAQLLLKATLIPDEGILLVQAQLTNDSYIFSRDCHLTGGFAFATWMKGEHAGDFVISLGGYHPDFKVPAHYPVVPRVGFNWNISPELSVKGGGYYALVPHAIMAGGYLNALFQTSIVKAWFNMNANFLLMWKPFHYDVQISIDIGIDLTINFFGTHHIGLEASADLHLWGPEFGGHAQVSVKVIGITFHFSIDFGAAPRQPDPIGWTDFRGTFLPADDKIASLSVEKGLERTVKDESGKDVFVINRKELSIVTSSAVPIKSLSGSFTHTSDTAFGIAPMNQASVASSDHQVNFSGKVAELKMEPVSNPVPSALWGQKMEAELNSSKSMRTTMTGVRLTPARSSQPGPAETVGRDKLAYDTNAVADAYELSELKPFTVTNGNATWKEVEANMMNATVVSARTTLLSTLGFDPSQFNCNQGFSEDAIYPPKYGELG